MSTQVDKPPGTAPAGQDPSSSERGFLVSALISVFSSSGPSGDWLTLFVIGGFLELTRRLLMFVWRGMVNQFWITLVLQEYDDSYCESGLSSCHLAASLTVMIS